MQRAQSKILIVEDDAGFRRGLVRVFEKQKFEVCDVGNAELALEEIDDLEPDFIVSDFKLPGIDGVQLLREIRKSKNSVPFILISAHLDETLRNDAIEAGAAATLGKPINLPGLRDVVERICP